MTQIEDLLRDALVTAPTPRSVTTDPLGDLERRVGRTRRRRAAVMIVVAAVVAAIVVPLSLSGSASKRPAPVSHPRVERVLNSAGAVASGGGYIWTLHQDFGRHHHGPLVGVVEQRKPGTLQVVHTYRVPGAPDIVAYGLNRLWLYGNNPEIATPTQKFQLSVINLASGHRTVLSLGHRSIEDLVFQSGKAWMLGGAPVQLMPLEVSGDQVQIGRPIAAGHATTLAAGNGLVYALAAPHSSVGPKGTVAIVNAVTGRPAITQRPDGHVLLVLPDGYLVVRHHRLVTEGVSRLVLGPPLRGRVGNAAATFDPTTDTVYVVTITGNCKFFPCEQELKYSLGDLGQGTKHPLAVNHSKSHGELFSLAADPSGSLLITDGQSLYRWTPSG